ncbi:TetR/AcrR family transcriptional regulator [Patulibacter minatonensis]|uniref:TetR/AcrR family transcriptional regulator n=1 Tax=Patulibacter minatonensis TaxID=298163 RepID=UPI00047B9C9E|nr:TetR/AcrR family transcriptional regulator [Patulibacter minatonensis]
MARPVDPERHLRRRLHIIDAALTRFAADGFDGASTAAICRTAGIGSGTFFHYFPTKVDVLLAILELGTDEASAFFRTQDGRDDPVEVLLAYVDHEADSLRDERAGGFVRAVGAVATHERVAVALARHQEVVRDALAPWVQRARDAGAIRTDLPAAQTIRWVLALIDGFATQTAEGPGFDARAESAVLLDTVRRFLRPADGG